MKARLEAKTPTKSARASASQGVRDALSSPSRPLDAATREEMEPRFGYDFSHVRVHSDEQAGESARALDARAYTVGHDVVFGRGQYAPGSPATRALLAHELAHVVQQRSTPPPGAPLSVSSPSDPAEREAHAARDAYLAGAPLPKLGAAPPAIHRQPLPSSGKRPSVVTDPEALIRTPPPALKPAGASIPVGTQVDITDTKVTDAGTFVNVVDHDTGKALGWTARSNLDYPKAEANFFYEAKVQHASGHPDMLPVMVYVSPSFDGKAADIIVYFHGDAADYAADTANNYHRENPAIGMDLKSALKSGSNQIIIAPQVNVVTGDMKSPWDKLNAGDYESIVQTVLTNLQADLGLKAPIARGTFSIAGHSGGGKALGQATKDLDSTGRGVADVTLVEAGYGGGEGDGGAFSASFVLARDWLLEGRPGKILRVITRATEVGTDTRHAIENNPDPRPEEPQKAEKNWRTPVLGLDGVRTALKRKKLDSELHADQTDIKPDPKIGGMQLIRTIVVSRTKDPHKGQVQGTIFVFLMSDPKRDPGVDTHFGVRNATIRNIVSGRGKGNTFGTP